MRGFVLFLEALLSFIILVAFLVQFFLPSPNSFGIVSFMEKNDRVSALMEAGLVPHSSAGDCIAVRYYTVVVGPTVTVIPICVS